MNAFNNLSNEEYTEEFNRVRDEGKVEFITFHPSYSYEEFIEGITVDTESESLKSGNLGYVLKEGIFKKICKRALAAVIGMSINEANEKKWIKVYNEYLTRKDEADFTDATKFVLIIDEINRLVNKISDYNKYRHRLILLGVISQIISLFILLVFFRLVINDRLK